MPAHAKRFGSPDEFGGELLRRSSQNEEWVALVDEEGREIGMAPKEEVHHEFTPLHRGFSVYLFERSGRLLVQRRAVSKLTWPGVWSNSCCGHPAPGESVVDAIIRRVPEELGVAPENVWIALPHFRYRAVSPQGIVENELCPVAVGRIDGVRLVPNPQEIAQVRWLRWSSWLRKVESEPDRVSPWARLQTAALVCQSSFVSWLAEAEVPDTEGSVASRTLLDSSKGRRLSPVASRKAFETPGTD